MKRSADELLEAPKEKGPMTLAEIQAEILDEMAGEHKVKPELVSRGNKVRLRRAIERMQAAGLLFTPRICREIVEADESTIKGEGYANYDGYDELNDVLDTIFEEDGEKTSEEPTEEEDAQGE
jgi:hypothetical protein